MVVIGSNGWTVSIYQSSYPRLFISDSLHIWIYTHTHTHIYIYICEESSRGVVANVVDCRIIVSEFELHSY